MKGEFHTILVLDTFNQDIFTCESLIVPRIGDQLPFGYHPYPKVTSVTLNINSPKSILLEQIKKQTKIIEKIGFEWNAVVAIVTIEPSFKDTM